jgi:hypothetical protein
VLRMTVLPLPGDRQESVHGAVRPEVNWSVETTRLSQESGS